MLNLDKSTRQRVKFGEVIQSVTDRVDDPSEAGVDRYVGLEHLVPGVLTVQRWDDPSKVSAQKLLFKPGDVIFGRRRAYQKKVARADFEGICSAHALVLRAIPGKVDPDFLPVFLSSDYFLDRAVGISVGSLSPTVNWRDLKVQEFDLPPLDEQKRIADLLWAVERDAQPLVQTALEVVEEELLASLLEEDAPLRKMKDVGAIRMGRQRSPKYTSGSNPVPYLRVANVGENELKLTDVKSMDFTDDERKIYSLQSGDILLSEGQSRELVGQSVLIENLPIEMCFQNTLIRFRADQEKVSPQYMQSLFRACLKKGVFADIARQTTSIAHLGSSRFENLEVPIPSLSRQEALMVKLEPVWAAQDSEAVRVRSLKALRSVLSTSFFGDS